MDGGVRATQDAKAGDSMDGGVRATQGIKPESGDKTSAGSAAYTPTNTQNFF
jgi:hypothetical protein